ncbi:PE family protein [[Mycobacterium] nativiensis]|uniref:PE family protein n=1 Tax=[Mycobacterium] nativiensis TaxID=2855503 RepID=A0ABU5Y4Q8_9MYCO|nr:PE family protein [Mycolicibacter sp. MYC340]MEB3035191.1 PE family protein [Mycolicibacter sp. MYC340]
MSFVVTQPESLSGAAGDLQGIGSAIQAQSAAVAAPTTAMSAPASDAVSTSIAALFNANGALFQNVAAQAAAIHQMFVSTLNGSGTAYATAEAANVFAAR